MLKEQRTHLRTDFHLRFCEHCLAPFYHLPASQEEIGLHDEYWNRLCDPCKKETISHIETCLVSAESRRINVNEKRICLYCLKPKKLIGRWCRRCRNNDHRREIKKLLSLKIMTMEDKELLETYKKFPIWKKEFNKVKL